MEAFSAFTALAVLRAAKWAKPLMMQASISFQMRDRLSIL
jgi:hypothetical protein